MFELRGWAPAGKNLWAVRSELRAAEEHETPMLGNAGGEILYCNCGAPAKAQLATLNKYN